VGVAVGRGVGVAVGSGVGVAVGRGVGVTVGIGVGVLVGSGVAFSFFCVHAASIRADNRISNNKLIFLMKYLLVSIVYAFFVKRFIQV